jgi:hypothetical protein
VAWTEPLYTRAEVREAGRILITPLASRVDREEAVTMTNNWRSSHAFPLNTLQVNLRRVANDLDDDPIVAQRIKRLPSIVVKLERLSWLTLDEMQDLGGCRAVLSSVRAVERVAAYYKERASMRHHLVDDDDYIGQPKRSGYRGVHLIYSYASDRKPTYNGQKIEMQLRSRLQHAWATAVETVGAFTEQALKSSAGERDWLRFFALMSSILATRENTVTVPGTPTDLPELTVELRTLATRLRVVERLSSYAQALRVIEDDRFPVKRAGFLLLELETSPTNPVLSVAVIPNAAAAAEMYDARERASADDPTKDVVLVRAESIDALRRAYPNYFADTSVFVEELLTALA